MSRQLCEAVRIDLRGAGVLNSKSEYSRCKVPRLTFEKEVWEGRQKNQEKANKEEAAENMTAAEV